MSEPLGLERRWFSTPVIPLFPENKNVFEPQEKDKKIHYDLVVHFLTPAARQSFLDSLNATFVCVPVDRTEELYRSSMPHIKYETIAELLLSVYHHCSPRSKETAVTNYVKDIFFHFNIVEIGNPARTERGGWQGRAQESLGAAWELRQSVVGHVADPSDLCSLALALPCALCAPCLLRLQLFCRPSTAPDSAARSATVALALFLAGQATSEALGELVRRCPGLSHALLYPCSLRLLAALPGLPPQTLADASAEGLQAACSGHWVPVRGPSQCLQEISGALVAACQSGCADVVEELVQPPFNACSTDLVAGCLKTACYSGSAVVVWRLSRPPFALGRVEAAQCLTHSELIASCVEVLDALAEPPYSLTHDDAKLCSVVLMKACHDGRAEIVRRLGQPPYCLGTTEVRMNSSSALGVACQHGHIRVVAELAAPPYSMGRAEAREADALMLACKDGFLEVVNALTHGPFYLGHWDAARRGNICLFFACIGGHEGVVRALAEPPYSITCDLNRPQSILDALAAVGPAAAADGDLRELVVGSLSRKVPDDEFIAAFGRSGHTSLMLLNFFHRTELSQQQLQK
eukprot:m51a1_g13803 hypothetical protein (578) ;mRNA; f:374957-380916